MRDPNKIQRLDSYITKDMVVVIDELPEYDIKDYDVLDDKDFKKYLYDVERLCRQSFEYQQMVSYMRENMNLNACSFYKNVSNANSLKVKIHLHHDPLDLFNIALIVFRKRQTLREDLSIEMVAKEVMYLHYSMLVGLVPLAETPHELVHNNYLFVPSDKVIGRYKEFVNLYQDYMLPEQLDLIEMIEKGSEEFGDEYLDILGTHYVYLDMSNAYEPPKYNEIITVMKQRVDALKQNPGNSGAVLINPVVFRHS